jgi:hypothetical protein
MRMRKVGLAVAALAALTIVIWVLIQSSERSRPPAAEPPVTVAAAFDQPPRYPGYAWTRNGRPVPKEVSSEAGPDHCEYQSATFLDLGWPIGSPWNVTTGRQYIRDPKGVVLTYPGTTIPFRQRLQLHAALPKDARDLGYRYRSLALYLSPSDDTAIYVVGPGAVERWPRSDPMTLCI